MSEQTLQSIFKRAENEIEGLSKLLAYGREKGFDSFINRKLIWPFLLGLDSTQLSSSIYDWDGEMDKNSTDYEQLQKDAERSLASMKTFDNITKFHLQKRQRDVLNILDSFFAKHKELRYIQGFHDVASIFLVLFGNSTGYYLMQKAGTTYFKDFLTKDIGTIGMNISDFVLALLKKKDPEFEKIFECFIETRMLIFIVPWVLTWFAHVFSSVRIICRIWDYILCTGPHGIIYLTAGILIATKDELLAACPELDQPSIHTFYQQKAKSESIDIEKAIAEAIDLEKNIKLADLEAYKELDPASVMLPQNFELQIDIHRRVKEYIKTQEQKQAVKRKTLAVTLILLGAATSFFYIKYGKKLGI